MQICNFFRSYVSTPSRDLGFAMLFRVQSFLTTPLCRLISHQWASLSFGIVFSVSVLTLPFCSLLSSIFPSIFRSFLLFILCVYVWTVLSSVVLPAYGAESSAIATDHDPYPVLTYICHFVATVFSLMGTVPGWCVIGWTGVLFTKKISTRRDW